MPDEKPKSSRWFTCLIKGPLGCLAFLFGASLVLVLFVPAVAGRLIERGLERDFGARHAGSLELGEAWLFSLYNPQRIDGLILRDPAGEEVLRGSLRAPPLGVALGKERYGPIELNLQSLKLVEYADGSTNLERTLARLGEGLGLHYSLDLPEESELVVHIERLRWTDARGREEQLADLVWRGTLVKRALRMGLELAGGAAPELAEPFSLAFELEHEFTRPEAGRIVLTGARVPLGLVRHLVGRSVPVSALAGPTLSSLEWKREGRRASLRAGDGSFALECAGLVEDGLLRTEPGVPARLGFDPASAVGEGLLERLAPLLVPAVLPGEARVQLEADELRLPLGGGWKELGGRLRFTLPGGSCALDPEAGARFGLPLVVAPVPIPAALELVDGRVVLDGLTLPLREGKLEYAGTVELATDTAELSFTRELAGVREPLGYWRGELQNLAPAPPVAPVVPEAPR